MAFQHVLSFLKKFAKNDGSTFSSVPPALGATANVSIKLRKHTISPYNQLYRFWKDIVLSLLVAYYVCVLPFAFAFVRYMPKKLFVLNKYMNGLFVIDIILTFFVCYIDEKSYLLVDDPKRIAGRYLRSTCILDICSIIGTKGNSHFIFKVLNMLRVWRLYNVNSLFERLEKDVRCSYFWIRFTKIIAVTLLAVHYAACLSFWLADTHTDSQRTWIGSVFSDFKGESLWRVYGAAFYWSVTRLTTTGYGDFHADNTKEMLVDALYMLFNLVLSSYVMGSIASLIFHDTSRTRHFRDSIDAMTKFSARNQLPENIANQIQSHLYSRFETEELKQKEIMDSLPKGIRLNIKRHLFHSIVEKVYLFQGVSSTFISKVITEIQVEYFPPMEDVLLQDEVSNNLYILVSGDVQLIENVGYVEKVRGCKQVGEVFGEGGVFAGHQEPFSVRTGSLAQFLRIDGEKFMSIVENRQSQRVNNKRIQDGSKKDEDIVVYNFFQKLKDERRRRN